MDIELVRCHGEYRLTAATLLDAPLEPVFSFFSQAENLEILTPSFLRFKIISPLPIKMAEGTFIKYRLRLHGLRMCWHSLISRWEPPYCFVDEQIRGPYRYWIHTHTFEARGNKTYVRDVVRYQVYGGRIVHELLVRKDLERIFIFRDEMLKMKFSPQRDKLPALA